MKKMILSGCIAMGALTMGIFPGTGISKVNAANTEASQVTVEGTVFSIEGRTFSLHDSRTGERVKINLLFDSDIKVGEHVKATGYIMGGKSYSMNIHSQNSLQVLNKNLSPGVYLDENYLIGHVIKKENNYVSVSYPAPIGGENLLNVNLTEGQTFQVGDKVKVEIGFWTRSIPPMQIDGIEKLGDSSLSSNKDKNIYWK